MDQFAKFKHANISNFTVMHAGQSILFKMEINYMYK